MKKLSLLLLTSVLLFIACTSTNLDLSYTDTEYSTESRKIENIRAFTKLYGYVRYFHPSDEALAVDWNRFAIYGVEKVKNIQTKQELISMLEELFIPLAPSLRISDTSFKDVPKDKLVNVSNQYRAWQYLGLGEPNKRDIFAREITGYIPQKTVNPIWSELDNLNIENKKFKLSARVKVDVIDDKSGAALFLIAKDEEGTVVFEDYMRERLIVENNWDSYVLEGNFTQVIKEISLGVELIGAGQAWVDDFELKVSEDGSEWESIDISNSNFNLTHDNGATKDWLIIPLYDNAIAWDKHNPYIYKVVSQAGNKVLSIASPPNYKSGLLFQDFSEIKSGVVKDLGLGINCYFPLALDASFENKSNINFENLENQLSLIDLPSLNYRDENFRLANVLLSWNIIQHFFPYFDVVDVDWNQVLIETIEEAIASNTHNDYYNVLRKMIAKTRDGHGIVFREDEPKFASIPFKVEWIEDQIVVTASKNDTFKKGDIVKSIDGVSAKESLLALEIFVSGSPQLKRLRAINQFGKGALDSIANLEILRDDQLLKIEFEREAEPPSFYSNRITEFKFPQLEELVELEEGIYYVNMVSLTKKTFYANLDKLVDAKGLIFDSRPFRPRNLDEERLSKFDLLTHLTDKPLRSTSWQTPRIMYPDQEDVRYSQYYWQTKSIEPYFKGKKVIINIPSVVSSGETFLGIIDYFDLAVTVGEATAGANGNANFISLIGGGEILYTGMKVEKHDGSQLFSIGYQPDYPVSKTIQAVRDGRDEYLEKALEIIKN